MNADPKTIPQPTQLCVVLSCFAGHKTAGHERNGLVKKMNGDGAKLIDDVVLSVDGKHKAHVHDPHRVLAGTLTPLLTWGIFGLLSAGDLKGGIVWAVIGALCGWGYTYASEHLITKSDLARIGKQFPADSSAALAYVQAPDELPLLKSVTPQAAVASAAAIAPDLSLHVPNGNGSPQPTGDAELSMTLLRYEGEHSARDAVKSLKAPQTYVELIVEVPAHGRRRVVDPSQGVAAMTKSSFWGWAAFGVVFGVIAGLTSSGGLGGALEQGVVTAVAWGIFGLIAGALYGLWAGRSASSRRAKGLGGVLPPNTSTAVVWIEGPTTEPIAQQIKSAARTVTLYFRPSTSGAVLAAS